MHYADDSDCRPIPTIFECFRGKGRRKSIIRYIVLFGAQIFGDPCKLPFCDRRGAAEIPLTETRYAGFVRYDHSDH
ncbi:MAG: hypothetical protein AAFY56_12500, partial [Pseudomonadota bacterium]